MTRRRGVALVLALVLLLAATATTALALQWATLQLQLGRAWRAALHAEVASHAAALQVLRTGVPGAGASRWFLTDRLALVRLGADAPGGVVELLLRGVPDPAGDTLIWRPVGLRGLLPMP